MLLSELWMPCTAVISWSFELLVPVLVVGVVPPETFARAISEIDSKPDFMGMLLVGFSLEQTSCHAHLIDFSKRHSANVQTALDTLPTAGYRRRSRWFHAIS